MPQAVLATISPPAIFRTGSEMPKKCRTKRPKNRNVTRMTNTQRPVLKAVFRRSLSVQDDVMLKKIGTPPGGSTMGNNARNVAAAECGSVRRNCPSSCVVAVMSLTDNRPALSPRAPAQPSKRPTAGAPAPRLPYREPRSLPESPPRHTPCIRPEHRWRGETRDGEAVPQAPAERAQRRAAPGSTVRDLVADSFASQKSSRPRPENVSPPRSPRSDRVRARRIYSQLFSWLHRDRRQSPFRILRSRKATRRHRPCELPPGQRLSPAAARKRNLDHQTSRTRQNCRTRSDTRHTVH